VPALILDLKTVPSRFAQNSTMTLIFIFCACTRPCFF